MIHLQCPHCETKLAVKDTLAGRVGACPKCKGKLRIPEPEMISEDDLAEDHVTAAPTKSPPRRSPRSPDEDDDEDDRPVRARRRRDDDDDDEPARPRRRRVDEAVVASDEDEPPRRPRKKRRRRRVKEESSSAFAELLTGTNIFWFVLAGIGALWLICFGMSFVFPPLALVPIGLGLLMAFAGNIWFLIVVFQDDVMQGILCLFVPLYSLYYLITNFDAVKFPFFVNLLGAVMFGSGICAGGMSGKRHSELSRSLGIPYAAIYRVEQPRFPH